MNISLKSSELLKYVVNQVNMFFPDDKRVVENEIKQFFDLALQRVEYCFAKINNKYYSQRGVTIFNHLNGDHYAIFLYYLSSTLYKNNFTRQICDKLFHLNRLLHGIDAFYEVELPDVFQLVHPLGTVLGRGKYSNYFIAYQRCGIGSNHDVFPVLSEYMTLRPGSSVIGNCHVGRNCEIAAGSLLLDKNLDDNTLYIGNPKQNFTYKFERMNSIWIPE